jgi:signal transduction histidine kinase
MLSFPVIHNGNVLTISVVLVAWIFRKKGLLIFLGVAFVTLVVYQWVRQRLLWNIPFTLSFISGFILLAIIGFIVVSLRTLLDSADEARIIAQEAERQTAIAFEQQRQLNDLKNQFILNVNHELRSPLTVISGYLSLLLDKYEQFDRARHRNFLRNALRSCKELETLTNDVLDTMMLSTNKERLHIEDILVAPIAHEAIEHFEEFRNQSERIHLEIPEGVSVRGNAQCLRQILRNLLSNAYKYSPRDTSVTVSVTVDKESEQEVCIKVKDEGPGILPDQIPLLFGQFVRLPRDLAGSVRGSGLGLYISKSLVEAMGGRIWVESAGIPGEGSKFCFTLPGTVSANH